MILKLSNHRDPSLAYIHLYFIMSSQVAKIRTFAPCLRNSGVASIHNTRRGACYTRERNGTVEFWPCNGAQTIPKARYPIWERSCLQKIFVETFNVKVRRKIASRNWLKLVRRLNSTCASKAIWRRRNCSRIRHFVTLN